MQRRTFLRGLVAGSAAAGASSAACSSETAARARARLAQSPAGMERDLSRLADEILATDAAAIGDQALDWLAGGLSERDVLSAAYLAGLREIDPSPIGGQVHALMMVASAAVVTGALPRADRALPVLFHLQRTKRSVARDARGEDWTMPAAPAVEPATRAEHVRAFRAAMRSWDEAAGDRQAVALHRELSLREFFEELWPWAARDFRIIGHKMIFATQTFRAVEDLGWRLGRDAVRAVVRGVLDQNPYDAFAADDSKAIFDAHEANLERLGRLPANWRAGREDPDASFELLAKLREAGLENAGDLVIAAATRGVGERSIWDGLRLTAFELSLRHPDIAGMHPVTSINALYRGSRITDREATRRLCVLQAADWMVLFRDFLAPRGPRDLRLDALRSAQQKGAPADPFGARSEPEAWSLAYDFAADPVAFGRRAYDVLAVKAQHDHDYKFTVAAVEELNAAHPRCRPALAAASMADLRRVGDPDNDAIELLRRRRSR